MRFFLILAMLLPTLAYAQSGDRQGFLVAWEAFQAQSDTVKEFRKLSDGKYHIKFTTLPYEGELTLLVYDVEDYEHAIRGSAITKTGYAEVDLSDSAEDLIEKYGRTYYKWAQLNNLYFDSESEKWLTSNQYTDLMSDEANSRSGRFLSALSDYSGFVLFGILLYFLWATILSDRRAKQSIKLQQEGIEKSKEWAEESLRLQKTSIDESIALQKQANQTLSSILEKLDKT